LFNVFPNSLSFEPVTIEFIDFAKVGITDAKLNAAPIAPYHSLTPGIKNGANCNAVLAITLPALLVKPSASKTSNLFNVVPSVVKTSST
jgi:hypothetical protein